METRDKGLILTPTDHSFTAYVDADFVGNWCKETAQDNSMTAKSRTGYVIMYAGCPIIWASKLQTDVALSTSEAEYSALSEASREVLWLIGLMKETKARLVPDTVVVPTIRCTLFEDNHEAITIANSPKLRPRTKHINVRMHHFWSKVREGLLKILPIDTKDQLADIATKPLAEELFVCLRERIMGW